MSSAIIPSNMSIQKSPAPPTTSPSSISDFLKPQYSEAVVRLKNSLIALLALLALTHLLPTPALYTSAWRLYRRTHQSPLEHGLAVAEVTAAALLLLNIAQSTWAIRAPPAAYPPVSPAKPKKPLYAPSPAPAWRTTPKGLSPHTTPQRQRPFSPPASDPRNLAQSYSLSFPAPSPDASFASSVSLPPSPSPSSPLAAYRGRRGPGVGRPLDTSLLARLASAESDEEES